MRWSEVVFTLVASPALVLIVGIAGIAAGVPMLFPSLGPTILLQVERPENNSARPYSVLVGHLLAMAIAVLVVLLLGANEAPPVLPTDMLTWARVWASVIAIGITAPLLLLLRAPHPPAAATTLLFCLGGISPSAREIGVFVGGVLIIAAAGEAVRRVRLASL